MRKRLLLLSIIALMLLPFSSCASSSSSSQQSSSSSGEQASAAPAQPKNVELVRSGWYYVPASDTNSYSQIYYAAELKNPNADEAILSPTVRVTAKSSDGKVLTTGDESLYGIASGDSILYVSSLSYQGGEPANVEITVDNESNNIVPQENSQVYPVSDFPISDTSVNNGEFQTAFTGEVQNNSGADQSSMYVEVIFTKDGKIIGGFYTFLNDLKAGEQRAFEIDASPDDMPSYDSYQFQAFQALLDSSRQPSSADAQGSGNS